MKISVAMCTYNGARFLREQLESILAQTRKPDEVIVCDDHSSDESIDLINNFRSRAPFPVRVQLNETRIGSTKNFERAISLANGDVIALSDQDDVWSLQRLEWIEQRFLKEPAPDLVFTNAELIDESGKPVGYSLWDSLRLDEKLRSSLNGTSATEILAKRRLVTGATMAFRACLKDLVLPIPENLTVIHDGWIALIVSAIGRLEALDQLSIKYRRHGEQQLGLPKAKPLTKSPKALARLARSANESIERDIKTLRIVLERLNSHHDSHPVMAKSSLEKRLRHLEVRQRFSTAKLTHLPGIMRELVNGSYHRYSNGFISFVKDVIAKP